MKWIIMVGSINVYTENFKIEILVNFTHLYPLKNFSYLKNISLT